MSSVEKKLYQLATNTEADWDYIHEILTQDGSIDDNIPSRAVECIDPKLHSPTRGVYLMSEDEVNQLSNHPGIRFINIDYASYPDEFKAPPEELYCTPRYSSAVKNYRDWADTGMLNGAPNSSDHLRAGYQLLRCAQKRDPWEGGVATNVIMDTIPYTGDGTDVDVIVGDDGCWFGHVEFQRDATSGGPASYRGGNLLPGNGTCDLLDLVLEGPYYLDPAWFNADAANRLATRWDGTIVPVESVARTWWGNASQRSSQFAAVGTVSITSAYTRLYNNGTNGTVSSVGGHGTQCCSMTFGRTHGWAFNANKWFIQVYNTNGSDIEQYFDIMKIFHQNKPINPTYGTRNPTISSNSWGYRATPPSTGYYYYRGDTQGVAYSTKPGFMANVGYWGDSGRMKCEVKDNSFTLAGEEMINAGVIFVCAAGNSNQKQVGKTHPDFNNYYQTSSNLTIEDGGWTQFGLNVRPTTNRRGFPQQLGKTPDYVYPTINIGALDDSYQSGLERKVNYSDMGEEIDCYAPADGTLAACYSATSQARSDTYAGSATASQDTGTTGIFSATTQVSGTTSFVSNANTGQRITTSVSSGTRTSITASLLGAASLTASTPSAPGALTFTGNSDDGYWTVPISFNISFLGILYATAYVGTNGYVTFGGGSDAYSALGATNPGYPKIMVSANDNSAQRIYYGTEGSAPNRTFRIRFEGTGATTGVLGSPNMVWELTFYENATSQFDVQIGTNIRGPSAAGTPRTFYDVKFSGTSAATPCATGLLATVLQTHRDWTWLDLRNWLRNNVEVQSGSVFYQGVESTTANASSWSDVNSLEGGVARVLYNAYSESYSFDSVPTNIDEGTTETFNVSTVNVPSGTSPIYWTINHITTSNADFVDVNGSFTITNNAGSFSISAIDDSITEGAQTFTVSLRTGSITGTIVATSSTITLNDTSVAPGIVPFPKTAIGIRPSEGSIYPRTSITFTGVLPTYAFGVKPTSVDEGNSGTYNVLTTFVTDGMPLYWSIEGATTADFLEISGTFYINSGAGAIVINPLADSLTEGTEHYTLSVRVGSTYGTVVAVADVYITDTSTSPPTYNFGVIDTTIIEGSSGTYNVITTNVDNGTTLYWTINHISTVLYEFQSDWGSFAINNNAGYFTIMTLTESANEPDETFTVSLRIGSRTGTIVATSDTITIPANTT
jgi:hypothetical protein